MAKKKKQNIIGFLLIGFFKVLWYILKGIYEALKFIIFGLIGLFKRSGEKVKEIKQEKEAETIKSNLKISELKEIENKEGSFEDFQHTLYEKSSTIGLILGARGTGKSALGLRILENVSAKTSKRVYAMGFKNIPSWIKVVEKVEDVKENSFVLIDESGITFSSRNFMSELNKFLGNLLLIARHKDLSIIFITQNSSNIDINIIRQLDYLFMKPSSLLQNEFERKKIADIYKAQVNGFKKHKSICGITFVYSDSYLGFVSNELPSFWSEKVSKSFR